MTIGDELGRKWEEAVIECVKGWVLINTHGFFFSLDIMNRWKDSLFWNRHSQIIRTFHTHHSLE